MAYILIWLVGCFGFNGPLRQYFSLYRAVSQREGERGEKGQIREKMSKQPPPAPTASATGPCPTIIQISRMPRHWKFTQHLRTTRPPPLYLENYFMYKVVTLAGGIREPLLTCSSLKFCPQENPGLKSQHTFLWRFIKNNTTLVRNSKF